MGCNFKRLFKKPKVFLRITGVSVEEFEKIVKMAEPIWKEKVEQIKVVSGRPYGLESLEGHILCLLIYYRTYLTQEFLGFLFDVDDSCISRSLHRISKVLAPVLGIQKNRLVQNKRLQISLSIVRNILLKGQKRSSKNIILAKRNDIPSKQRFKLREKVRLSISQIPIQAVSMI